MSLKELLPNNTVGAIVSDFAGDRLNNLVNGRDSITINELAASVTGYAKPSNYEVNLTPPPGLHGLLRIRELNLMKFNCHTVSIPPLSYGSYDYRQGDWISQKRVNDKIYGEVKLTFYNVLSGPFSQPLIYNYFVDWMELIMGSDGDGNYTGFNYYDEYAGALEVIQRNDNGDVIYTHKFDEFYPNALSGIELSYSQLDSIGSFTVSGSFR